MSCLETEDYESTDISDALINEAARLENEILKQAMEETKPEEANGSVSETDNFNGDEKIIPPENPGPVFSELCEKRKSFTVKNSEESSATKEFRPTPEKKKTESRTPEKKKTESRTPEKKKTGSSSLKRKATDDSLESIRPQPPDPKPLKKGFKIPKKTSSTPQLSTGLTEEQKRFLAQLIEEFSHRYTDLDEDYKKASESCIPPPLVEKFFCPPRRQFNQEGSSHYHQNIKNSYGHSHRHGQYQANYSRDHSNRDRDRDYQSSRDPSSNRYDSRYRPY